MVARSPPSASSIASATNEEDFDIWDSRGRLVAQSRPLVRLP
jgi:hypothetical protein